MYVYVRDFFFKTKNAYIDLNNIYAVIRVDLCDTCRNQMVAQFAAIALWAKMKYALFFTPRNESNT